MICFNSIGILAAETDQFTNRNIPLEDASQIVNTKANESIQKSLQILNTNNSGCNEKELYKELRTYFGNHMNGQLTKEIIHSSSIPKRKVDMLDSIFKDWTPWDGFGMGFSFMKSKELTLTSVIRIGDNTAGTDKFEHFFGQGFSYFSNNYLEEKGPIKTLKIGVFKEKTILGGNKIGNGVFSFGDLAANFNGMRFWNHMLLKNDDILGSDRNLGPYISCIDNKWSQTAQIDFKNYFDESMDESINCSKFPSGSTVIKVKAAISDLGLNCPVDQSKLDELKIKYRQISKWIINSDGIDTINYFGEFKE